LENSTRNSKLRPPLRNVSISVVIEENKGRNPNNGLALCRSLVIDHTSFELALESSSSFRIQKSSLFSFFFFLCLGAFELGATVCPIAIKYNKAFADTFWNSREMSFTKHVLSLMKSWAVVCDIVRRREEDDEDVLTKINSMPYCTTDQLRQLQSQGNVMAFLSQNCRPAGVDAQAIRRFIGGNNDPFAMIPSKVNLEELFKQNEQYFSQARGYVSMFMLAEKALIAVVLGVISLLILINIHHKKAMGIFVGVPVILASVGVIGLGKLIRFLSGSPLQESIKMPENAKNLLMDITGTFGKDGRKILNVDSVYVFIFFILHLLSYFQKIA